MANVIRIANTGIFYANSFDEVTFNANSGVKKNLFAYSKDLTNSYWQNYNDTSVATSVLAPDGTNSAFLMTSTGSYPNNRPTSNITVSANTYYTLSGYVKYGNTAQCTIGTEIPFGAIASFDITNGTNTNLAYTASNPVIQSVGNGWWRISVVIFTATYTTIDPEPFRIGAYNGQNPGEYMYCWGPQFELGQVATIYEPTGANAVPSSNSAQKIDSNGNVYITGALDEVTYNTNSVGAVKNLFNSSQNLLTGNWGFSAGETVTTGTFFTAPDGTQTAQQMVETAVTNSHNLGNYGQCYAGLPYTFSVYLKKGVLSTAPDWVQLSGYYLTFNSCFANFNLTTGQIGIQSGCAATITAVGNGWYRCTITVTCSVTYNAGEFWVGFINNTNQNTRLPSYLGSTTSDVLVWGAQMEQNSVATIYQPTAVSGNIASQNSVIKVENTGNTYTIGNYDEWAGIVPTTNGLVFHMDGAFPQSYPGTGTRIYDMTGNGNDLTGSSTFFPLYNPNYGSFYYDGIQYKNVNAGNISPKLTTNSFSLEVWIKPTILNTLQGGGDGNIIFITELYPTVGFRLGLATPASLTTDTTAGPQFFTTESGGNLSVNAPANGLYPITVGKWNQIVVTHDGVNTGSVYVNGNFILSSSGTYKPITTNVTLFFGGPGEGTRPMIGESNSYKWYNRAITAQEVLANFNGLRNRYGI